MECDAGDVASVAFEGHNGVGVSGLDIEEFDIVVAGSSKEALVWCDAKAIDLGVGVLDGSRADAR